MKKKKKKNPIFGIQYLHLDAEFALDDLKIARDRQFIANFTSRLRVIVIRKVENLL